MDLLKDYIGLTKIVPLFKEEIKERNNKYRKTSVERYLRSYFSMKKSISKSKNIKWDLDIEWFFEKYVEGCSLTKIPFYIDLNNKQKGML